MNRHPAHTLGPKLAEAAMILTMGTDLVGFSSISTVTSINSALDANRPPCCERRRHQPWFNRHRGGSRELHGTLDTTIAPVAIALHCRWHGGVRFQVSWVVTNYLVSNAIILNLTVLIARQRSLSHRRAPCSMVHAVSPAVLAPPISRFRMRWSRPVSSSIPALLRMQRSEHGRRLQGDRRADISVPIPVPGSPMR